MRRSLSKDITAGEMLQMREEGMTNREIAQSLDCSYQTVLRYIGQQPADMRSSCNDSYVPPRRSNNEPQIEESIPAALLVQDRCINLVGDFGSYEVSCVSQLIRVKVNTDELVVGDIAIPFDKIDTFISELSAIKRKMSSLANVIEAW